MKRRSSIRRKMMSWFCFFAIFPILFLAVTAYGFSYATLRSREFDYAGKQLDMVLQSLNQQNPAFQKRHGKRVPERQTSQ